MSEITILTYYQRNRDLVLNKKGYYKSNKERLKEQVRDKYRSLSEEEEENKKERILEDRYHNMPEEKNQRLKEYQKEHQNNYHEGKKKIF